MDIYNHKTIDYGHKKKEFIYRFSMEYSYENPKRDIHRTKYEDMNEQAKEASNERRIKYYKKKIIDTTEIALMNSDLTTAITLTFKDKVTSYDIALGKWQNFLKRLRHHLDFPLKYICVWEYQKKRSQSEGIEDGGIYHFHCIMNIGYIDHKKLSEIWGNGYVWIDKLDTKYKRNKTIHYIMKYISKDILEHTESRGKRYIFTSNNLNKPIITYDHITLENLGNRDDTQVGTKEISELIFEHLDNIIKDGSYTIKNKEQIINYVQYIEYKTK